MSSNSPLYDQIFSTARAFIDSQDEACIRKDVRIISSALAPHCQRYFGPVSYSEVHCSPLSNDEFELQTELSMTMLESWQIRTKYILVDQVARRAVCSYVQHVKTRQGVEADLEMLCILDTTDSGEKIERVEQFVDSLASVALMKQMRPTANI